MSIFQRIKMIFGAKANKALDRAENPNETLDYSYQKQLDLLPVSYTHLTLPTNREV